MQCSKKHMLLHCMHAIIAYLLRCGTNDIGVRNVDVRNLEIVLPSPVEIVIGKCDSADQG